jgi:SAM-dependent methyltransferase
MRSIARKIKKTFIIAINRGTIYRCPICGYKCKRFKYMGGDFPILTKLEVIGSGRRRARCFRCDSTDRERLLYLYLKDYIHLFTGDKSYRILHIAPEKSLQRAISSSKTKHQYICGDLFAPGYNYPENVINLSVTDIPFKDNWFDIILCSHVLEHVRDDKLALQEIFRVLKPKGLAILQVPISKNSNTTPPYNGELTPKLAEELFGQKDHVRIYGQDYPKILTSCGFSVECLNISRNYIQAGVVEDETLYLCKK